MYGLQHHKNNFKTRAEKSKVTGILSSALSNYQAFTLIGERDWEQNTPKDKMHVSINTVMSIPLLWALKFYCNYLLL